MNFLTLIRYQNQLNEKEGSLGIAGGSKASWHEKYSDSAWIYIGGLPYDLNEGDVISVFSQYGEVVNINLIRDHKTGKSRGFAFLCYEDQRSTILAVDNFNGIKLLKRTLRVDHVEKYKVPKYNEDVDQEIRSLWEEGCAPKATEAVKDASDEEKDPLEELVRRGLVGKDGVLKLSIDLKKKMKEENKRIKKEAKRQKKEEKLHAAENHFPDEFPRIKAEPGVSVDEIDWRAGKKFNDTGPLGGEDIYEKSEHFNFGKPKKEIPPPPSHNIRPDFEKADWRDIEIWKAVREREKMEKGEKETTWKEEEHYLPQRFN